MALVEVLRANLAQLETISGVKLGDQDIEELAFHLEMYLRLPELPNLPDHMLPGLIKPRQAPRERRRILVEAIQCIWRERRGQRKGSHYDAYKEIHDGPLLRFIQALLKIAEVENPPSAATIHHDLDFIYRGEERDRGDKRRN